MPEIVNVGYGVAYTDNGRMAFADVHGAWKLCIVTFLLVILLQLGALLVAITLFFFDRDYLLSMVRAQYCATLLIPGPCPCNRPDTASLERLLTDASDESCVGYAVGPDF